MTESGGKKRLIVNADDFGLTEGINRGIVDAWRHGIVTSVSIAATGEAFEHAVGLARQHNLDLGIHLTLIEERPLMGALRVPSLMGSNGGMAPRFHVLLRRLVAGRVRTGEVRGELKTQIERCLAKGLVLSHLDSHQHVHVWPSLLTIAIDLAKEYSIPAIRCPRLDFKIEPRSLNGRWTAVRFWLALVLSSLSRIAARRIQRTGLYTTDYLVGILATADLNEYRVGELLSRIRPGTTELVVHPGEEDAATNRAYGHWGFRWQRELEALTSQATSARIREHGIALVSYRTIAQEMGAVA